MSGAAIGPALDNDPQSCVGREERHSTKARGLAVGMINFAARTRGHIAYRGGVGVGEAIAVGGDTLFSARTWKNEFR